MITHLAGALVSAALITCLMLALPARARPTLPFGVRVPAAHAGDPVVVAQRRRYARLVAAAGALAVPLGTAAGPAVAVTALFAADLLLYYLAHRAISAAKSAGAWGRPSTRPSVGRRPRGPPSGRCCTRSRSWWSWPRRSWSCCVPVPTSTPPVRGGRPAATASTCAVSPCCRCSPPPA